MTGFDANKIAVAMTKAFLAVEGGSAAASPRIHETVRELTHQVVDALTRRMPDGGTVHIEDIQDQVELALMRSGEHKVARAYVLYREEQAHKRAEERAASGEPAEEAHIVDITLADGSKAPLDVARLKALIAEACRGLEDVSAEKILEDTCKNLFDGVKEKDVGQTLVMAARTLIDQEPNYSHVAARLLHHLVIQGPGLGAVRAVEGLSVVFVVPGDDRAGACSAAAVADGRAVYALGLAGIATGGAVAAASSATADATTSATTSGSSGASGPTTRWISRSSRVRSRSAFQRTPSTSPMNDASRPR